MASWSRILCAAIVLALAAPAFAQTYRQDEIDRSLRTRRQIAIRYAKLPAPNPEEFGQLRDYFTKYHLPALTLSSSEGLQDLEKLRVDLFKQLIYPASGRTQRFLSEEAKKYAKKVIDPRANYHPAVVYNGVLVLGMIDKVYASGDGAPTPDEEANRYLCGIAKTSAEAGRFPSYMLAGALIGLDRHTRYLASLPQESQKQTISTLGKILMQDKLAGEYGKGVRDWIYLKAARGLANQGSVGTRGAIFKAIGTRMADESLETETRAELAAMLEDLNPTKGQVQAGDVAKAYLALVVPVAEAELKIAQDFEDMQIRRGGASSFGGGRDKSARRFRSENREVSLVRGDLLKLLKDLKSGAETLAELAEGEDAAKLTTIAKALQPAIASTSDSDAIDLNVSEEIKQAMRTALSAVAGVEEPEDIFQ